MKTAWATAPARNAKATRWMSFWSPTTTSGTTRISAAARPLRTPVISAGATNAYRALRYARSTSATATSGTIAKTTGTIDAAVVISDGEMPGAVRCTSGAATSHDTSTSAAPTTMTVQRTIEMRWSVWRSPRRVADVRNAGTSAWFAATITTAMSPSGIRDATKNASVLAPAPKRIAIVISSTSPPPTPAAAAIPVRPDWRTTVRLDCRSEPGAL